MKVLQLCLSALIFAVSAVNALSQISISGRMSITDDETFGDEHATRSKAFPTLLLGSPGSSHGEIAWKEGMGGEVRIEVYLTITLLPSNQAIRVNYNVKLFEGTSESSDDLDGEENGVTTISADRDGEIKVRVRNTDEGGDYADVVISIVNDKL
jgi:hypothetical protein